MTVKDITDLMGPLSSEEIEFITKAYNFAEKAHGEQKRYSGEPYFIHPFETAKNLAVIGMGATTIVAGLLHDTIEDAGVKDEVIEKEFGKEILFLVQGVTKLGRLQYHGHERHVESLRKLFIAMTEDVRVLIIKLADRLHNMRTLQYRPDEKRRRIASETLEIYAPLSDRLGIWRFTRELEDLSFQYAYPEKYAKVLHMVKQKTKTELAKLEKFRKSMRKVLAMKGVNVVYKEYRIKNIYSLYRKLERKEWDMDNIYDMSALRVVVPTISECYKTLGVIHGHWRPIPGRVKDYIAVPKPNGYQSIHTTAFTGDGGTVEIQIRTEEMHQRAEYGIASHIAYKEKQDKKNAPGRFSWLRNLLPSMITGSAKSTAEQTSAPGQIAGSDKNTPGNNQLAEKNSAKKAKSDIPDWIRQMAESDLFSSEKDEFMENLKEDLVRKRIFVFTPRGDVVDLPIDSSPIDFAFAIHSDIGNHISGAQVNGKQSSLDTKLKNGDTVEIQTRAGSHPSAKWLEIAKTAFAKKHIKTALDKQTGK